MSNLYLLTLVPILLTEYGFQASSTAIQRMRGGFIGRRFLFRLLFWVLLAGVLFRKYEPEFVLPVVILFLLVEICCQVLRHSIRADARSGLRYGSVRSHLIPFVLPGVAVPVAYGLLTLHLHRNGLSVDLGKALVAELFSPLILMNTKALAVSVVFLTQWTWASLFSLSVEHRLQLDDREELVDPRRARREAIGVMERLVTLLMVVLGGQVGAGLVVAIKSTSRLPKLTDRQDAEQFVVETLGSVGLATLGGFLINTL